MTDTEAETGIYGHLMWRTNSFGKTLLLGKIENKRRREPQRVYGWMALPISVQFSSFSRSVVSNSANPWIAACQVSLSITNSQSSLRLKSIESVMPSSHLILCRPLLLLPTTLPESESFSMNQLFAWGGRITGVSALAPDLPTKRQGWSPSEWTGWIFLQSKGMDRNSRKHRGLVLDKRVGMLKSMVWQIIRYDCVTKLNIFNAICFISNLFKVCFVYC